MSVKWNLIVGLGSEDSLILAKYKLQTYLGTLKHVTGRVQESQLATCVKYGKLYIRIFSGSFGFSSVLPR
jgi:hypothetical protein